MVFSSLYLGTGTREKELVSIFIKVKWGYFMQLRTSKVTVTLNVMQQRKLG